MRKFIKLVEAEIDKQLNEVGEIKITIITQEKMIISFAEFNIIVNEDNVGFCQSFCCGESQKK